MPIRRIVRASCAAFMVASLVAGIEGEGILWWLVHVLGACLALFLVWASARPRFRAPAFVLFAAAAPAWVLLVREEPSVFAFTLGGAMVVGMGSCVVHYRSDPAVLRDRAPAR